MNLEQSILSDITIFMKYAKYLPDLKRRESWDELVTRNKNMHIKKFPNLEQEIEQAYSYVYEKKVLPSMRSMQFAGKPIEVGPQRIFNCAYLPIDDWRSFQEVMFLLLSGCVPPDTKILTESGIKEIKDIKVGEKVISYDKISDEFSFNKVIATHDVTVPKEDNIKISGLYGNFTTSKKHPVLVCKEGSWKYIPAGSIKIGDIIRRYNVLEETNIIKNISAYYAGAFIGDGTKGETKYGGYKIRLNGDNEAVVREFANSLSILSGIPVDYKKDTRITYDVDMWCIEKQFHRDSEFIMKHDSLVGNLPNKKVYCTKIPDWIKSSYDQNVFMSFIAGLIDTDGTVTKDGKIVISTSSELLKKDLVEYLPIYGIYSWVSEQTLDTYTSSGYKPTTTNYRIIFSCNSFYRYCDFISHDIKQFRLKSFCKNTTKNKTRLVIPEFEVESVVKELGLSKQEEWHFKDRIYESQTCYADYFSRRNINYDRLLIYDVVSSIEDDIDIPEDFKDLTVENNHSYVCGDGSYYVLHNCGVGFSVQNHHIEKLPHIVKPVLTKTKRWLIADSIEGWADAIKVLMKSYFSGGSHIVFDFRDIRPKGARLVTAGGKAPGPQPLKECLIKIEGILSNKVNGDQLSSLEIHDIVCHIADAVLAGGIRRSALISLFSVDDAEMISCKSGSWWELNPQRGRANNSAVMLREVITESEFMALWDRIEASGSGEPGTYVTSDKNLGTNPCCEISLRANQFCNLVEINAGNISSQDDLNSRAKAAAFIGTLQASYTNFHYLRPVWQKTTEKEALLGIGMTGIASGALWSLDIKEASLITVQENARVAELIGINKAARIGTIKPSGTSSLVLGCSSGIHAWHNDYYIRRLRVGKNEVIYSYLKTNLPDLVEDDYFRPHDTAIIKIPQKAPDGSILRTESPIDLLERVKYIRESWILPSHNYGDNTHNVSVTVSIKPNEWESVGKWMWENRSSYNGISVLPYDSGTYVQAPFEDCDKETFELLASYLHSVDLSEIVELEDNTELQGEIACSGSSCEIS